ncbi:MAG: cadherin repeat domain-containing protein, partial [Hyphomicrobiales bacterium]|nr:cadherin repeat domain-containing protein [Hyphomicrobiales bacterium]
MADPVIEKLSGDTLAYLEGAGSKFIDQGDSASVSDTDTTDFADGSLTVTISSGGDFSEDFLSVNDKGSLTVVSDELVFSGDTFATFTGGSDGDALVIDFNDSGFAGIDAVSALLRAITYQNSDDENPTVGDRTVQFMLDDGGGGSASVDATVSITPTPDDPVIADLEDDVLKYTEDDAATVIDQGTPASVTDVDSANFDTGLLSVAITVGGVADQDVLGIRNQGTGVGEIGVSGSDVTFGGVVIGTVSGGSGGTPLDIQLNATATPAATSGLLANITYQNTNTDAPSVARRTVSFDLNDGAGGIADLEATVDVIAKNDAPLVHLPPTSPTVTEDSEDISISPAIGVEDVDGDTLTVTMTASSTMTMTTITNLVFSEGNGLDDQLMSFTGAVADINNALATLSYTPTPDQDTGGQIAITVSDGKDETTDTLTINITPSQDEPVTTSHGGASEVFLDIAENTTAVTQVTAEDADTGDVLTFSIKDSDDGAFFDVDPVTGVVSFKSAPDFETPADGDG